MEYESKEDLKSLEKSDLADLVMSMKKMNSNSLTSSESSTIQPVANGKRVESRVLMDYGEVKCWGTINPWRK